MKRLVFATLFIIASSFMLKAQHQGDGQMPSDKFNKRIENLRSIKNESQKLAKLKEMVLEHYFTVEQIKLFAELLSKDYNRLEFIEAAYGRLLDKDNYYILYDIFSRMSTAMRFHDFIENYKPMLPPPPPPPLTPPCRVSHEDFELIQQSISKESFSETKVSMMKQILSAKKCFTTLQIKDLVKLFDFEEPKLEMAKYAYEYCIDKQNYYLINDVFSFSTSKEELSEYIQNRH